jgi:hypothetical protein
MGVVEALADGLVADEVRSQARLDADRLLTRDRWGHPQLNSDQLQIFWAMDALMADPARDGIDDVIQITGRLAGQVRQLSLFRDVFGNSDVSKPFSDMWRTSTAVALAEQMYESRDFGAMPILADALQDAGCDNEDILSHCRDAKQVHVRGCWVADLVLGKE